METSSTIQSAQNGNLNSFNELVLKYQNRLFNIALRMLGSEACAEDAVQNAFILAYRSLAQYRGGSFDYWLLRILKNVCYDELRRQKRQPLCPLEPWLHDDEEIETPASLTDHAQNPTRQVEMADLDKAIQDGLHSLSPEYRLVIALIDIDGQDYAEAARIIGVPLGTVKSRLARARLKLRAILLGQPDLLPGDYARFSPRLTPPHVPPPFAKQPRRRQAVFTG
ncbi:MAG: sigma-70 family RNA polymerase sigma factor [Anaerolineales bacterium]